MPILKIKSKHCSDKGAMIISEVDVIVLMAGEGRRLLPLTNDRPKALLHYNNGISIFEQIVRVFSRQEFNITIIPVIGHARIKVQEELSKLKSIANIKSVTNPFYSTAGPMVSLFLGLLNSRSERVVVLNGDTIIKDSLVRRIIQWYEIETKSVKPKVGICITETDVFFNDDMKILLDDNKLFIKAGKNINSKRNVTKSSGVMCTKDLFSKDLLKERIEVLLINKEALGKKYYWHNILNEISSIFDIDLIKVDADSWYEVDTDIDYNSLDNIDLKPI